MSRYDVGSNPPAEKENKRIPALDGIRGSAILLVLLWHYLNVQLVNVKPGSALAYIKVLTGFSWSGVDLFFVLSGFLITGILLDNRNKNRYFRTFYFRRVCRILPIYYLFLGLFALLTSLGINHSPPFRWLFFQQNAIPLWSYGTFTQNIFMGIENTYGSHWLGITWSLAVEEQFYLFMPFVIRYIRTAFLPYLFISFIVLAPLLRHFLFPGTLIPFVNTPWRADPIMMGALLAFLVRSEGFLSSVKKHSSVMQILFMFLLTTFAYMILIQGLNPNGNMSKSFLAFFYAFLVLIPIIHPSGVVARFFYNKVLIGLGMISYGVYVYHQAVSGILHGLLGNGRPQIYSASDSVITLAALLSTLMVAYFSYRFIERPIIKIGHKTRYES